MFIYHLSMINDQWSVADPRVHGGSKISDKKDDHLSWSYRFHVYCRHPHSNSAAGSSTASVSVAKNEIPAIEPMTLIFKKYSDLYFILTIVIYRNANYYSGCQPLKFTYCIIWHSEPALNGVNFWAHPGFDTGEGSNPIFWKMDFISKSKVDSNWT